MVWIKEITAISLLTWLSLEDVKTQKVPVAGLLLFLLLGMLFKWLLERSGFGGSLLGFLWIFGCAAAGSMILHKGIGRGDIWLLMSLPFWKWGDSLLWTCLLAFAAGSVYGLLHLGLKNKQARFPFVPFITGGYAFVSLITCVGRAL